MPIPVVEKDKALPEQRANYLEELLNTKQGLDSTYDALRARRSYAGAEESAFIDELIRLNQAEYLKVDAEEKAYLNRNVRFAPPSDDDVKKIKEIVKAIDGILAATTKAQDIMKLATGLLNEWHKTRPV